MVQPAGRIFRAHDFLEKGIIEDLYALHTRAEIQKFFLPFRRPAPKQRLQPAAFTDFFQHLLSFPDKRKIIPEPVFHKYSSCIKFLPFTDYCFEKEAPK